MRFAKTTGQRTPARAVAACGEAATAKPIPLQLAKLVSPYRANDRVSFRIERLPRNARLTCGRINGDNSWSLSPRDLDAVSYLPPANATEAHSLAIRVMSAESGDTLALLDLPVPARNALADPGHKQRSAKHPSPESPAGAEPESNGVQPERRDVRHAEQLVVPRAAEDRAHAKSAQSSLRQRQAEAEAALATAKKHWMAEESARLAITEAQWAERTANAVAEARAEIATARAAWQQEFAAALANARSDWKSEESARLAIAEAQWGERTANAAAEAQAEIATARAAWQEQLAAALANARSDWKSEEISRLAAAEGQWTELTANAVAEARAEIATARAAWQEQLATALANAQSNWQSEESARLAAAEAQWAERTAKAAAEARAEAGTSRDGGSEIELQRLRSELASTQAAIATREAELAEARAVIAEALARGQQGAELAVSRAEAVWKTSEAARLDAARADWQQQIALAVSDARAAIEAELGLRREGELGRLKSELASVQTSVAARDAKLAEAHAAIASAVARGQQAAESAVSQAEVVWKASETARLDAARAEWQQQTARAVLDARAAAEAELGRRHKCELGRLQSELETTQTVVAARNAELAGAYSALEQTRASAQRDAASALSAAEKLWKASEAARLDTARAEWQQQTARAVSDARAAAEIELGRLQGELAAAQTAAATREAELAEANSAIATTRASTQQDAASALSDAEKAWKASETERLAAALVDWQQQTARAVSDARADADVELGRLQAELAAVQAAAATREAELAEANSAIAATRASTQQDAASALSDAEKAWKAGETERLAAALADWQQQTARAVSDTRAAAEAELSRRYEGELKRLHAEIAQMQGVLAGWDLELRQARTAVLQERARGQQEYEAALASAERKWKAREAAYLAAAKEQSRVELERAVAEARNGTGSVDGRTYATELRRLRSEVVALQVTLTARESELRSAQIAAGIAVPEEPAAPEPDAEWSPFAVRRKAQLEAEQRRHAQRRMIFGAALAAGLAAGIAVCGIVFHHDIERLFSDVKQQASEMRSLWPAGAAAAAPAPAVARPVAVVLRSTNVRVAPSGQAEVMRTLQPGTEVATIDRQGNWTLVQFTRADGATPEQDGWVYSSFLKPGRGS